MATQAQARAELVSGLDAIGKNKADYDTGDVFTAAENDVANFITRVKENIQGANMIVTGGIEELSIVVTTDEIQVKGNYYLLFQDKGVKGSVNSFLAPDSPYSYKNLMPPIDVFIDYIRRKNINLKNESQFFKKGSAFEHLTEEEQIRSAAFLMARKVFKEGFKPRNVFSKELPKLREDLRASIKNFAIGSIKDVFKQRVK